MYTARFTWLAIACIALLTGCGEGSRDRYDRQSGSDRLDPQRSITDRDVTSAIETELSVSDAVDSHRIDVSTRNGIVSLSGRVSNLLASGKAVEHARSIKGVRAVVDSITVVPPGRSDEEIQIDARNALVFDPATDSYEVQVTVREGKAILGGTVDSWAERALAEEVVSGVNGVIAVDCRIQVERKTDRPDAEIARDIEQQLARSVWIDAPWIDVKVEDGEAVLSGVVGSAQEKHDAITRAWVAGVHAVDSAGLEVKWWARDRMRREDRFVAPSDGEIREAVRLAFFYDPRVSMFDPVVTVDRGVVTLTGTVDNLKAKRAAEADAENTIGVWRVKNHLRVRPKVTPTDAEIRDGVQAALLRNPYVDRFDVTVRVRNGHVYLYGAVDTSFQRWQAERVAETARGVVHVTNHMTHRSRWTRLDDWQIEQDIIDQLAFNPFIDPDQVMVDVEDGVATLTGTVETVFEWRQAEDEARDGGARRVVNELEVRYVPTLQARA